MGRKGERGAKNCTPQKARQSVTTGLSWRPSDRRPLKPVKGRDILTKLPEVVMSLNALGEAGL